MPNGPAIDGTESGLLDVPIELVRRGHFNKAEREVGRWKVEGAWELLGGRLEIGGGCWRTKFRAR